MKRALVTGATRGAGRAIALALARAGWEVHALGRDRAVLDEMRADAGVVPLAMDLTDRDQVRAVTYDIDPTLMVHAALRWPEDEAFVDLDEAAIDMVLEVNLSVALQLTHTVLPGMIATGHGHVFFVLAPTGGHRSELQEAVSSASEAFARTLRQQVGPLGIAIDVVRADAPTFSRAAAAILSLSGSGAEAMRSRSPD
ncbi:SDR family NAD(P)-dependent oxidoreductase [Devosia sp. SL43]|uniref:SDR family NAD(P)-dependent oxidoreductase n=1 Tax=Devosia sp. SL43 TaxID=2806348 RepID=UPI001F25E760|nr:SDR family oxidoreductase [Devosia sp. SL43]UJW86541.1 SDR family oxidoreductase [Devosia sp. SL43]